MAIGSSIFVHTWLCIPFVLQGFLSVEGSWDEWWTYDGISGPDFWGLLNPEWSLCNKGKLQSPIDIKPELLLFDPFLLPLRIDKQRVNGILENNGHSVVFHMQEEKGKKEGPPISNHNESTRNAKFINISGGPLSYNYRFQALHLHFGRTDRLGSEHRLVGVSFPAELQIVGFNSDLYKNASEASRKTNGLVAISLLIQISDRSNLELKLLTNLVPYIKFTGQKVVLKSISIRELIPDLQHYITYDGSMTVPPCSETVTWIIINKPIFITKTQLYALRKLMQGENDSPKAPLGNNFRPTEPVNHRVIRTNIDFQRKQGLHCPTLKGTTYYQVNSKLIHS